MRPISLLNIATKLISNVLAEKLKNVLPSLISSDQTAYVKGRFISEGGRLISDVLEICDKLHKLHSLNLKRFDICSVPSASLKMKHQYTYFMVTLKQICSGIS